MLDLIKKLFSALKEKPVVVRSKANGHMLRIQSTFKGVKGESLASAYDYNTKRYIIIKF